MICPLREFAVVRLLEYLRSAAVVPVTAHHAGTGLAHLEI